MGQKYTIIMVLMKEIKKKVEGFIIRRHLSRVDLFQKRSVLGREAIESDRL